MKYKVIGWTHCGTERYEAHKNVTACVDNAIAENIREKGYCFGGDVHEDYCPVLNDGTYALYSTRGWGAVMAKAYNVSNEDGYAYMAFYMDDFIKPEAKCRPNNAFPNDENIVPKESLIETFEMHLSDDMFTAVKVGSKTVELRLFDEKRQLVDIGDYIEFVKESDETQRVKRRVSNISISETFLDEISDMNFDSNGPVRTLKYTPRQLGFPEGTTLEEIVGTMYRYYYKEQEDKYGVIAFCLEKPKHTCRTQFSVWTDAYNWRNLIRHSQRAYINGEDDSKYEEFTSDPYSYENIEECVTDLVGDNEDLQVFSNRVVEIGNNDVYDRDVNVMLRKTLKNLFGKEESLRAIQDECWICMTLDIVALTDKDAKEPPQKLELDEDIKEFLQKANVELNLKRFEI